jgi:phenylalanyl-tRNA synthetase beta chain
LTRLGFNIKTKPKNVFEVYVPSWRARDIGIKEDLVEEVARIYGYFNLPSVVPLGLPAKPQDESKSFFWENKIKNLLYGWGLTEIYSYSFVSEELAKNSGFPIKDLVKLKNPLSQDYIYMRPTIIPSLLQVINQNKQQSEKINLFELANIYLKKEGKLPEQKLQLAMVFKGEHFYKMKGFVQAILKIFGVDCQMKPKQGKEISFIAQNKIIATVAMTESPITTAQIDFQLLASLATDSKTIHPIPKYPPIIEDLTFEFPTLAYYAEVVDLIKATSPLISKIELRDSYKNKRTLRIYYQHPTKSLTDQEISSVRKSIVSRLESKGLRLVGKLQD